MKLLLSFPNLNLFSHEKKLLSSSRKTSHSEKTINYIHSRLNSVSKVTQRRRGKAGFSNRNPGVWPSSFFIIYSRASEMSRRILIPKVSPMECTDHVESLLDTGLNWWHLKINKELSKRIYQPSLNVCSICQSWWVLYELCHREQVS